MASLVGYTSVPLRRRRQRCFGSIESRCEPQHTVHSVPREGGQGHGRTQDVLWGAEPSLANVCVVVRAMLPLHARAPACQGQRPPPSVQSHSQVRSDPAPTAPASTSAQRHQRTHKGQPRPARHPCPACQLPNPMPPGPAQLARPIPGCPRCSIPPTTPWVTTHVSVPPYLGCGGQGAQGQRNGQRRAGGRARGCEAGAHHTH